MGSFDSQQRAGQDLAASTEDRVDASVTGPPWAAFVGRVFAQISLPTSTGKYFCVHPVAVLGTEAEGNAGSLVVNTSATVTVYVTGSHTPAAGDDLICRFVGNRWVADRFGGGGGGSTVLIPGCLCSQTPAVITMTASNPASNNGMFQNCVISYGPTPPEYSALLLGPQCFLSAQSFPDLDTGDYFRYYVTCSTAVYSLSRVYATSLYGSPFKDILRYLWLVGAPGNTCSPFLMSSGQIYVGGDPSCVVVLSQ